MTTRTAFTSHTSSRSTMNGRQQMTESRTTILLQLEQRLTAEHIRAIQDAMRQAGIDFDCSERSSDGTYSFSFSTQSRHRTV